MSKQDKLTKRLLSCPKDFTWKELVRILNQHGYEQLNGSGSKRKFINSANNIISLHEPHPSNIIKRYILEQVIDKLGLDK